MRYILLCLLPIFVQAQSAFDGNWKSKIVGHDIFFQIDQAKGAAFMSVPAQGLLDMKSSPLDIKDDEISFHFNGLQAHYDGKWDKATNTIKGTWRQGFNKVPLDLVKAEKKFELIRPQNPQEPFPYISEDYSFYSQNADIQFAGTITRPDDKVKHPAVVLISGSGPQNRDGLVFGHKTLAVLGDYLTRNGYVVLRYDERGVGQTNGHFQKATSDDFADDVSTAISYLKNEKYVDTDKIGLIGHSEGGLLAAMVAAENENVDFIVSLAGPGQKGSDILDYQMARSTKNSGLSKQGQNQLKQFYSTLIQLAANNKNLDDVLPTVQSKSEKFLSLLSDSDKAKLGGENQRMFAFGMFNQFFSPWMLNFIQTDPSKYWKQVKVPTLALNGCKDKQVVAKSNLKAIKNALQQGGNQNYKVKKIGKLNHLFQKSKTGDPSEYAMIETTIDPKALETILTWLNSL